MYWQNGSQGPITLGVMFFGRFSKFEMHFAYNFYVCGPTSMKLIPHLVSEVGKVYWQNGGHGPITRAFMTFHGFSNFAILENFRNRFLGFYET